MLKPYTRNKLMTDKIIDKCMYYSKTILETILKGEGTLYSMEEIPKIHKLKDEGTLYSMEEIPKIHKLKDITGVDNAIIVVYVTSEIHLEFIDKHNSYSIHNSPSTNTIGLLRHLVGLYEYRLLYYDKGYIIKTNYKSIKEIGKKFNIELFT